MEPALFEQVLFDTPTHVVGISSQRTYRGLVRKAIEARDRGCQYPGCDAPSTTARSTTSPPPPTAAPPPRRTAAATAATTTEPATNPATGNPEEPPDPWSGQTWQLGQKKVLRPWNFSLAMAARQRLQVWPARSYTLWNCWYSPGSAEHVDVLLVGERRAAVLHGLVEDLHDRAEQPADLHVRERPGRAVPAQAGLPQDLVAVDVADAGDEALVHQQGLQLHVAGDPAAGGRTR